MAYSQLELPEKFIYKTQMKVRVSDLNIANHLAYESMVAMLSEGQMRFFSHFKIDQLNVEGLGLMVADLRVSYRSEAFYRDLLQFEVGIDNFNKYGCDIIFRVNNLNTGKLASLARISVVAVDYVSRKIALLPESFKINFLQPEH